MKRTRKKFFGCIGLFVVAAMTVVAYSMPTPNANAKTSTGDVDITLTVNNGLEPTAHINRPYDGYKTSGGSFEVEVAYTDAINITGTVTNNDTGLSIPFGLNYPADQSSIYIASDLNLDAIGGFGNYTVDVAVTNLNGTTHDGITFSYLPVIAEVTGHEKNNDPIITISEKNEAVEYVTIQVYTKPGGTPLFDTPLQYPADEIVGKDLSLLFANRGAKAGDYDIEITSYAGDGEGGIGEQLYEPFVLPITYAPVPDVPDTGAFLTRLNITEADYLLSGLIIFFVLGICFIVFMKKSRR